MAQHRVNIRFVGIALVTLVVLLGTVIVIKVVAGRKDPTKYVKLAEQYEKEGNLRDAAEAYKVACDVLQKDTSPKALETRVKYGDVLNALASIDPQYNGTDRQVWDSVLTIDPTNRNALSRMLKLEIEDVEFKPNPRSFQLLHDLSDKINKLTPYTGSDDNERKLDA